MTDIPLHIIEQAAIDYDIDLDIVIDIAQGYKSLELYEKLEDYIEQRRKE